MGARFRRWLGWRLTAAGVGLLALAERVDPLPMPIPPTLAAGACRTCKRPLPWAVDKTPKGARND